MRLYFVINLPDSMSDSSFSLLEYKLSSVCSMPWNMLLPMLCIFHDMMGIFFAHTHDVSFAHNRCFVFLFAGFSYRLFKCHDKVFFLCTNFMLFFHYFFLCQVLLLNITICFISSVTLQFTVKKRQKKKKRSVTH